MRHSGFLASSVHPPPPAELIGFAFSGADLIIGDEGRRQYEAAGSAVGAGDDGVYATVGSNGRASVVGTDFVGYRRLFLYRDAERWALGDSFIEVAEFAADRGWTITPRPSALQALAMQGAIGSQLVSHLTAIRQIEMLPAATIAVIRPARGGSSLRLKPRNDRLGLLNRNYTRIMRDYATTWLGRLSTLLASDLPLVSDLTGGRDSRTVLAALLRASELTGTSIVDRMRFRSGPEQLDDFEVASSIAARYGLVLNERGPAPVRVGGDAAFREWRRSNLGVYGPVYLQEHAAPVVSFGGAGGESHRVFYRGRELEHLLDMRRKYFFDEAGFSEARASALADVAALRSGVERTLDPRIVHYRHFRDRLHGGRAGQTTLTVSPLASRHLRQASAIAHVEARERSQVIADLMVNFAPDLARMPYDTPDKALDERHWAESTDFGIGPADVRAGRVFGTIPVAQEPTSPGPSALELFGEELERSIPSAVDANLVPSDFAADAREYTRASIRAKRFSHAADVRPAALVVLAGTLVRLSKH